LNKNKAKEEDIMTGRETGGKIKKGFCRWWKGPVESSSLAGNRF